ncbi:MAG: hypothetical protein H6715_06230 [Myxococcales bacterium]|nr:hypothetical protein [Myxococcales bacterium]
MGAKPGSAPNRKIRALGCSPGASLFDMDIDSDIRAANQQYLSHRARLNFQLMPTLRQVPNYV